MNRKEQQCTLCTNSCFTHCTARVR